MIIEEKITFDRFIRWSLTAPVVIVVLLLMNYLSSVLLPFFVAWLLAYPVYPVVKFVQYRLHVPTRVLSIIVSLVFLVAVIGGVFYLIIPPMIAQFDKFGDVLSNYLHEKTHIANFPVAIQQWIEENKNGIKDFFHAGGRGRRGEERHAQSVLHDRADGKRANQRRGLAHHPAVPLLHTA